jgi:uncharacterized integral membrane protein
MALIAVLILLVAVAIFAVENSGQVALKFAIWSFQSSLVYIVLGALLIGALVATAIWSGRLFALRRRAHEAEVRLRKAEADLAALRGPVTDAAALSPTAPAASASAAQAPIRQPQTPGGI